MRPERWPTRPLGREGVRCVGQPPSGPERGEDAPGTVAGFSIIEVLITAIIVAVALLAIATMFPTAATNVDYNAALTRATALAQQRIEQLKNDSFATLAGMDTANVPPTLPASEEQAVTEANNTFTRRTWVQVAGATPTREATVTVMLEWEEPSGTKTLRLDTLIAEVN